MKIRILAALVLVPVLVLVLLVAPSYVPPLPPMSCCTAPAL